MKPAVSVICTVRNASETVLASLSSVLVQDLEGWELVVVDDGSTDQTVDCIVGLAEGDSRIHVIRTGGVGRARALNLAVQHARADLIANLDADDLMHPLHLKTLVATFRRSKSYSMLCTAFEVIGASADQYRVPLSGADCVQLKDVTPQLLLRNPVCHSSILISKEVLLELGGYEESLPSQFDYDLWIRMAHKGHKIGCISLPLVAKRIHERQSFEATGRFRYLLNSLRTQARAIRTLNGRWYHWPLLVARFFWGLRPRRKVRRLLKSLGHRR